MAQMSSTNTTRKISFRKIARAALAEVRVHKKLAIITYVLYGVALLLFLFNTQVYTRGNGYGIELKSLVFYPSNWGIFFAVCGAVVSFFTVLNVFRDMNNQQICDVSMALPIKASERFLSKLLSLLYIQILPQLVSVLGGNGIRIMIARIMYGNLPGNDGEMLSQMVFMMLAGTMFLMSITVLCVCCCGAPAESSYFSIILMGIINVLPLLYIYYITNNCAGFNYFFGDTSVFDYQYWGILFLANPSDKLELHCSVGCVISLAVMLLSGLIYIRRDAKTVGTPVASRVFFELTMTLGCFTVFMFFLMDNDIFWGLLIAAVAFIIINIIVSRAKINALSFLKWGAKYLAITAAFVIVMTITIKTGGFGYIYERPAAEDLDGAKYSISYYDYAYVEPDGTHGKRRTLCTNALTPEQADEVMKICKKHLVSGRLRSDLFSDTFFFTSDGWTYITVRAVSDKTYNALPEPQSQFQWDYETDKYQLYYYQELKVPFSEAKELADELTALSFVYEMPEEGTTPEVSTTTISYD